MNNRDLQNINSSGELTEIKIGGTEDGNKVLTSDEVDAKIPSVGYKVYTALLNQSGTDAPVATVLENAIGTINLSRLAEGIFLITSDELFTTDKTIVFGNSHTAGTLYTYLYISSSQIQMWSQISGVLTDNAIENSPIEIKVYD